jgi:chaperone BCS1
VMERLNFFTHHKDHYDSLGIPYSLGFMLHGAPGTGKTSLIKAVANYTKRHIVEISLSRVKKFGELKDLFLMNKYKGINLDFQNKIIVFEDIDCMTDVVKKRTTDEKDERKQYQGSPHLFKVTLNDEDLSKKEKWIDKNLIPATQEDPICLSNLLNLIDGIIEQPGRILFFTTNHHSKLDPALIRPGRVDLEIEFTLCSSELIRDIVQHMYKRQLPKKIKFKSNTYSPAQVIQKCLNTRDFDAVVQYFLA